MLIFHFLLAISLLLGASTAYSSSEEEEDLDLYQSGQNSYYPPRARRDKFTFDLNITCNITTKPKFWYSINFFENDVASSGDQLKRKPYDEDIPTGIAKKIQFICTQDGDEILSKGYSLSIVFEHDCTDSGEKVEVNYKVAKFCPIGKDCNIRYNAVLTNESGNKEAEGAKVIVQ